MFEEDEKKGEGWIVSFADLMTLLFALFVVLYGLKEEGETMTLMGVVSSIREAFVEIPEEIPEEQKSGPIKQGEHVFKYFKGDAAGPPVIKRYRRTSNAVNIINEDFAQIKEIAADINKGSKGTQGAEDRQEVLSVHRDEDGIAIRLAANYFYDPGSYRVKRGALDNLRKLGSILADINRQVTVEGHTDALPPSGDTSNLELSALRAAHVGHFLEQEVGVSADRLSVAGYGSSKPVGSNHTPEGRSLNRRVEIKVRYED